MSPIFTWEHQGTESSSNSSEIVHPKKSRLSPEPLNFITAPYLLFAKGVKTDRKDGLTPGITKPESS